MKNVLVSREWVRLVRECLKDATFDKTLPMSNPYLHYEASRLLAMPDFVKSEEDVEMVADALIKDRDKWMRENEQAEEPIDGMDNLKNLAKNDKVGDMEAMLENVMADAQAAINTLRLGKEGGE